MNSRIKVPSKHIAMNHNVTFVVRDAVTHNVVSVHRGHNAATNSLLEGIGHYLTGDGILNQGWHLLSAYVPKYISLGTMGLINQDEDENGLPAGIGVSEGSEEDRFKDYLMQCPGYGADGYDPNLNNNRQWLGLGPTFANREDTTTCVNCELISDTFPRASISFRDIVPETESEFPQTIDVVYSAMISTGALAQFRDPGKDYLFITEAGLWSRVDWVDGGDNGLLAGYRIAPPNEENLGMNPDSVTDEAARDYLLQQGVSNPSDQQIQDIKPEVAVNNRNILKQQIIRVGINQVVQVIWKIQLGGLSQLGTLKDLYSESSSLYWIFW